jgi:prolyl 4-hydroxylase
MGENTLELSHYENTLINENINLRYIKNFLTKEECEFLVCLAHDLSFTNSVTTDGKIKERSSQSCYIPKKYNAFIECISDKVSNIVGKTKKVEQLQVVKYEIGEKFGSHFDWLPNDYMKNNNLTQRKYTFFVYLNTVENGGLTNFPKLDLSFKPEIGNALFWQNCDDKGVVNYDTLHEGTTPISGTKYGLNIWVDL